MRNNMAGGAGGNGGGGQSINPYQSQYAQQAQTLAHQQAIMQRQLDYQRYQQRAMGLARPLREGEDPFFATFTDWKDPDPPAKEDETLNRLFDAIPDE